MAQFYTQEYFGSDYHANYEKCDTLNTGPLIQGFKIYGECHSGALHALYQTCRQEILYIND